MLILISGNGYFAVKKKAGFTLVEILIVVVLLVFILYFVYQIFFSQTKTVTKTIDALQANEGFRRVLTFMGDDIKEATRIVKPTPVHLNEIKGIKTTVGSIMILQSSEIDPKIRFDSPLGGQISQITTVEYELEPMGSSKDVGANASNDEGPLRYRLVRNVTLEEKNGEKSRQRQVIADSIKELIVFRTVRRPFKPTNLSSLNDRLLEKIPLSESGTGNSLIHLKMSMERHRSDDEKNRESIYTISMNTSFYKRGKEIFLHP